MPDFADIKLTPDMQQQILEIDRFNCTWSELMATGNKLLKSIPRVWNEEVIEPEHQIHLRQFVSRNIENLLNRIKTAPHSAQEIDNYCNLLNYIYDNYEKIELSEESIKQMHLRLLENLNPPRKGLAQYKTKLNRIIVRTDKGKFLRTIFSPILPEDTPRCMQEIIAWFNDILETGKLHPLVAIGIFINHFLAIHPFADGNGRLARLLIVLLMLKAGYCYVPYSSIEAIFKRNKISYYCSLYLTNSTFYNEHINYSPWLSFFLSALMVQVKHLNSKIQNLLENKNFSYALNILNLLAHDRIYNIDELAKILNTSETMVKKAIKLLFDKKYLNEETKNGQPMLVLRQ